MPRLKKPCIFPECDEQWTTLRCARCRLARYCCADHQKQHWKQHKEQCEEVGGQGEWVAEGVRKEAPEVGRKPFIWEFRPIPHWSPQYDADNPDKIGWDWRGEQRCKQELEEAKKETRKFAYRSTTEGLDAAQQELRQNCAWLYRRTQLLRMLLEQLRAEETEAAEAAGEAGAVSDGHTVVMVTAEHIASLQAAEAQRTAALGGAWGTSGGQTMFITNSVEMDLSDLEGADVQAVQQRLGEVVRMHAVAAQAEQSMHDDMKDRKQWDQIESGHETRDVLENGIRRAHMEARLGRIATREDIKESLKIPFHLRPKIMGYDPAAAAIEGGPEPVPFALPFKEAPEDQRP